MNDPAVEIRDLNFSYRGGNAAPALEAVNLTLERGGFYSIIGPNGGGKSTLLKLILGILKPDSGSVRVLGLAPEEARLRIGYMPQSQSLDAAFPIRVLDVVLMGRLRRGFWGRYSKSDVAAAMDALSDMGVADLSGRLFRELSGGQRQRILIARALACSPEILLLDEPTANVDPGAEMQFHELLGKLRSRMTLLTVSHDLGFVRSEVDEVVCVNRVVSLHKAGCLTGEIFDAIYRCHVHPVVHAPGCCGVGEHYHE